MTGRDPGSLDAFLEAYGAQVLRWNRQINLVSRQDTPDTLKHLFRQCVEGFEALWGGLGLQQAPGPVSYFDLGSGGGLPGIIWHRLLSERVGDLQTCLVEPREKRAWFLQRQDKLPAMAPFGVWAGRWEDVPPLASSSPGPVVVISLKALHLTDPEVLAGLKRAMPDLTGARVVIARYYPAGQACDQGLLDRLEIPAQCPGLAHESASVLSWGAGAPWGASLVLSRYL
jgi:hypothetical protein